MLESRLSRSTLMQLVPRCGAASEMMTLHEEARERRLPGGVQRLLPPRHWRENRHRFSAPGDDDPLSGFNRLHVAGQALIDLPQAHSLFHGQAIVARRT